MQRLNPFSCAASWMIGAALLSAALITTPSKAADATRANDLVNVNSSDLKTLEKLPGVTPTVAHKIIDGRPYSNLADLKKATGLSNSKLNAIKDSITFGPEAATSSGKKSKSTSSETSEPQSSTASSQTSSNPNHRTTGDSSETHHPSPTGRSAPSQTVNINTATVQELDALPGIGPTKAQAIIDFRNQHGPFNSIEDIKNVKGIKEGEFAKLKDYIRVK